MTGHTESDATPRQRLEAASRQYLQPSVDRQVDRRVIEMVAQFVIPRLRGEAVLELGAGDRVWTAQLLDRFPRVTTVDASSRLIDQLTDELRGTERSRRWSGVVSLFEQFQPAQRFDTVLAAYVLDHLRDPLAVLRRARQQWLAPQGQLVVIVAHAQSLHRRLAVQMGLAADVTDLGPTNLKLAQQHCFRDDQLDPLLKDAGFRTVEKRGLFLKPLPNELLAHCSEAQLRGLFELGQQLPLEYSAILYYELAIDAS